MDTPKHGGNFTCIATNSVGKSESTALVEYAEPPPDDVIYEDYDGGQLEIINKSRKVKSDLPEFPLPPYLAQETGAMVFEAVVPDPIPLAGFLETSPGFEVATNPDRRFITQQIRWLNC